MFLSCFAGQIFNPKQRHPTFINVPKKGDPYKEQYI